MGKIFINYRRGDDAGFTQALFERLEVEFGSDDLFMDVEGKIKPGDDFVEVLNKQVSECHVLLAVIGPRWTSLMNARKNDRYDFVVVEIEAALTQGKRIIPVLVGGGKMPRADDLPDPIWALARRHAVEIRQERFKSDSMALVKTLKNQFADVNEKDDAYWEEMFNSDDYALYLEKYPNGRHHQEATLHIAHEDVLWNHVSDQSAWMLYLDFYPSGTYVRDAYAGLWLDEDGERYVREQDRYDPSKEY